MLQAFVFYDCAVDAVNAGAFDDDRRVIVVAGLESDGVILFEKHPFKCCFVRFDEADKASLIFKENLDSLLIGTYFALI